MTSPRLDGQRVSPWLIHCIQCGAPVEKRTRMARQYCSDKCFNKRKNLRRGTSEPPRCRVCKNVFERASARQKFCLDCRAEARRLYTRDYNRANVEAVRQAALTYSATIAPKVKQARQRGWWDKHKDRLNAVRRTPEEQAKAAARLRKRLAADPNWRLHIRMASSIHQALREQKAGRKWEALAGYTREQLAMHLERQFLPGMSWDNMGEWHIDHIVPRKSFAYATADDPDFKACWALTNLRPLWAADNIRKHANRTHLL